MGISYLIDTHVLLWWVFDDPKLCKISRQILKNPNHTIYVSSASAWEISTKYRIGKMPETKQLLSDYQLLLIIKLFSIMNLCNRSPPPIEY